jgi:3-hydroxyacyl-[acyl-carrier-protein] dehydratase
MVEDSGEQVLETADILRIMDALPHRYPFLLVDRIIAIRGDDSCIGIKNVTINEPHFMGHFPGKPVMPGVLLIEGMAQTAGAVCILRRMKDQAPQLVYFMTVDKCRFRRPVVPGDRVEFHMQKIRSRNTVWRFRGEAKVDGQLAAEAEVSAMMVDA